MGQLIALAQREGWWFLLHAFVFTQNGASPRPLKVTRINVIINGTEALVRNRVGGTTVRMTST